MSLFCCCSYLKEGGLNPSFSKELCRHQQPLLQRILVSLNIKFYVCIHAANHFLCVPVLHVEGRHMQVM